jgi:hypothetical protein
VVPGVQSFVFEGKKAEDECSSSPELSKARVYVDVLMKKHFGNDTAGIFSLILTIPYMEERSEEEAKDEGVRAELNYDENKEVVSLVSTMLGNVRW